MCKLQETLPAIKKEEAKNSTSPLDRLTVVGIWDPESRKKPIPDPGVKRNRIRNTALKQSQNVANSMK